MKKSIIIEIISGLLIILFMYASLSKLLNYTTFRLQVSASQGTKQFAAIAWILPVAEIIITALLTVNYTRKYCSRATYAAVSRAPAPSAEA